MKFQKSKANFWCENSSKLLEKNPCVDILNDLSEESEENAEIVIFFMLSYQIA